tara:strand:- start:39239 stop:39448 length:210 start_codon:yes stop_codon:yes gene_type:complete
LSVARLLQPVTLLPYFAPDEQRDSGGNTDSILGVPAGAGDQGSPGCRGLWHEGIQGLFNQLEPPVLATR